MLTKLLIANRGEIAIRICRTCRRLGIKTVAVYSEPDRNLPYVRAADAAAALGGVRADESYLVIDKLLNAALSNGCDAIHPGYGFLSESIEFAERIREAGLIFVGPEPATLRELGEKDAARRLAAQLNIPLPPGYDGAEQSDRALLKEAQRIGLPLLIKAAGAGGGRGMRRVDDFGRFAEFAAAARREASAACGNDQLILERLIEPARHIEVQLMGDGTGNVLHFFERDCSAQRRYQKVIEISPAADLAAETRRVLLSDAVKIASAAKLKSAATAEFLVTADGADHYFLEVNPRLQVEHPVTELVTGIDLVELQLQIASGEKLKLVQSEIAAAGAAIEVRVYAEIPERGFIPSTGIVSSLQLPAEDSGAPDTALRIDHSLEAGYEVSNYYDPMLAKVIAGGADHAAAVSKLLQALTQIVVGGVDTNLGFALYVLRELRQNALGRNFFFTSDLDKLAAGAGAIPRLEQLAFEAAACARIGEQSIPRNPRDIFYQLRSREYSAEAVKTKLAVRSGLFDHDLTFDVSAQDAAQPAHALQFFESSSDAFGHFRSGLMLEGYRFYAERIYGERGTEAPGAVSGEHVVAPLPGVVLRINVDAGSRVNRGDVLVILESMKMEHAIRAAAPGIVEQVCRTPGASVQRGDALIKWQDTGE